MTRNNSLENQIQRIIYNYLGDIYLIYHFTKETLNSIKFGKIRPSEEDQIKYKSDSNNYWAKLRRELAIEPIKFFLRMVHIYLFAIFEAFNKDFFLAIYIGEPKKLRSKKKTLNYQEIIELIETEGIIHVMATREVDKFGRMNIDDFGKEINKKFKIDIPSEFDKWKGLRENYYRRNIIVHNKGLINEYYVKKIEEVNLDDENKELINDFDYIDQCTGNIWEYVDFILGKIVDKFKLNIPDDFIDFLEW